MSAFFIQETVAFNQSHNQFLQAMNKMKTKWHTLAGKQILHKPIGKLVKKRLKYSVHMTKAT